MTTQEGTEPSTIAEIEQDIELTRARLGDTVDELSQRLDVKAHVKDAAHQRKVQAAAGGAVALAVGAAVIRKRRNH